MISYAHHPIYIANPEGTSVASTITIKGVKSTE